MRRAVLLAIACSTPLALPQGAAAGPNGFRSPSGNIACAQEGARVRCDILATTSDGLITAARLGLPETAAYARVEVTDAHGAKAWTNPVWP